MSAMPPSKRARVDDDEAVTRTKAKIGAPPAAPACSVVADAPVAVEDTARVVRELRQNGFCALRSLGDDAATRALTAALEAAVGAGAAVATSELQNSRRARNFPPDASLKTAVLDALARGPAGAAARGYVRSGALEVQGVQDIAVVGPCAPQEIHRDHQLGPGRAAVVAVSLDGSRLGTELVRGTHLLYDDDVADDDAAAAAALSKYVSDNRYSTGRSPKAAAMLSNLTEAQLLSKLDAATMIYDPFVYHRGAASDAPLTGGRVFIMCCDATLGTKAKAAIRSTNDIKHAWNAKVPAATALSRAPSRSQAPSPARTPLLGTPARGVDRRSGVASP